MTGCYGKMNTTATLPITQLLLLLKLCGTQNTCHRFRYYSIIQNYLKFHSF